MASGDVETACSAAQHKGRAGAACDKPQLQDQQHNHCQQLRHQQPCSETSIAREHSQLALLGSQRSPLGIIYQKITWRLMPIFIAVVMLNQIDRNNLSYAALTMNRDLGFSPRQYGLGSALFFISFFVMMVPSNLIMLHIGVRRWLALLTLGWGCIASFSSMIHNITSFYILRLLLGVFEAGAVPAMWFHLTQFFPQERLTKPYTAITVGVLLANVVGAPMAAGFLLLDGLAGLHGWQWLFLLEGLPSVALAAVILWLLPETPVDASWLSGRERELLQEDMADSARRSPPRDQIPRNPWTLLKMVFKNPLIPHLSIMSFLLYLSSYTFIFWLPVIINALLNGTTFAQASVAAQQGSLGLKPVLLTSVPYAVASVVCWIVAHITQTRQTLYVPVSVLMFVGGGAIGLFSGIAQASVAVGFISLIVAASAVAATSGPTAVLASRICSGPSLVVGMPTYNSIGVLGGFAGPFLTGALLQSSGGFRSICIIVAAMLVVCGLMMLLLKVLVPRRERRLATLGTDWAAGDGLQLHTTSKGSSTTAATTGAAVEAAAGTPLPPPAAAAADDATTLDIHHVPLHRRH